MPDADAPPPPPTPAIPPGSWVVVTGANGFIASHISLELLRRGYRVRGTVRDLAKCEPWLAGELFADYARAGAFELAGVPDIAAPGAFARAIEGASGIVHVASVTSFDPDPSNVVPPAVAAATGILRAALAEPSVRRFVFTSSSSAAAMATAPGHVGRDTWNDAATHLANTMPKEAPAKGPIVYMASKVAAEKAVWEFADKERPQFAVNVVSPFTNFGRVLHKNQPGSTTGWVKKMYLGLEAPTKMLPSCEHLPACFNLLSEESAKANVHLSAIFIHVDDVALLHAAALLDPNVNSARLQAWNSPFNWRDVAAIIHRLYPDSRVITDVEDSPRPTLTADTEEPLRLLKAWGGRDGFRSLEEAVKDTVDGVIQNSA
ncbi:uncharacterized protein E0L32_005241 [Thyridium curvatum]|uniref:NAD-dependent epimerase/dehydratase domain-containing protein n=1 Tax=Thyridium curvatum TaxID=1093900 RepID=A0A507BB02_9PEZI|nr:uncharacterized protein E0L32_005241 [Thyridium curvatum]TPX14549.1 hypothetical protein E0L32_005241 [Thyridium curvatum]